MFTIMSCWSNKHARGSALVYILIAIALLAALTVTFMQPSGQQTTSQSAFRTTADLEAQANQIRAVIQKCVLSFPQGDNNIPDPGVRKNYPIDPDSAYYNGASPGRSGDQRVKNIRCPGNNPGSPNEKDHALLFSASTGDFLPPKPDLFDDWEYYNGDGGIFFWTKTNKTDPFIAAALEKLDDKYSECEADVIDATGGNVNFENGGTRCPNGYTCFRMIVLKGDDTDYYGDEAAAGC